MAEENTAATSGGVNRRTIIIIAAAGLAAILLIVGIMMGILYLSGALNSNDEIIERLNAIEGGGGGLALSAESEADPNAPQLLELPDTNRLDTLYHQFAQVFVVNVMNSRKVMQLNLTLSTHYDELVINNVIKHELAVRSAILEHLSFVTEEETLEVGFRQKMGEELAVVVNAELEQTEGFGGIERILFTEFLMQ
jgi:flagellar FliL protein|tara:strand:- start:1089 stop:1673 length:585 start_codon:yes stop_codon:yes gene_type:complete